jgi:hypothetical protein
VSIEVLTPQETQSALRGRAFRNEVLGDLTEALIPLADTESSVWAEGLSEPTVNMLRSKLARRGIRLAARKVQRGGVLGHVLLAKSIQR